MNIGKYKSYGNMARAAHEYARLLRIRILPRFVTILRLSLLIGERSLAHYWQAIEYGEWVIAAIGTR